ncbi:histidinol-phosphate transaminase [Brenneria corticis]|uniref:histidinol-phosphate transaminase n=1 Tax=Brenneria corticis TaxID=2173106 RepID=A0A2U1TLF4_9GAMM|nr:histidinol-phosphate transaminase [Brenneria sp. CFCC 11842]PWC10260.1 histidinol-phosphate transaminase [Brenneria sp. CFCC 11842]
MSNYISPYKKDHNGSLIKLATNENPYATHVEFVSSLEKDLFNINRYPETDSLEIKSMLGSLHGVANENIILGAGSDELITLIAMSYIAKDEYSIMSNPSFFRYKQATENVGGYCSLVNARNFNHDLELMAMAIKEETKVVFLCNPNNPTGTFIYLDEIEAFIKKVPKSVLVVVDEAYFEYVENSRNETSINLVRSHDNLIILRSFSKFYGLAGLRIGYAIAQNEIIKRLYKYKSPYSVNSLAISAVKTILPHHESYFVSQYLANFKREKKFFYQELDGLNIDYIPSQANFVFANFSEKMPSLSLFLSARNIAIRNCEMFGYPQYARITIGSESENKKLFSAIRDFLSDGGVDD